LIHPSSLRRPLAASALVAAGFLCLFGCRGKEPPSGEVSGKVTFEGKPVTEGMIFFQNPETGASAEAQLTRDGTYTLGTPLPTGEYRVYLMPLIERRQVDGKGPVVGEPKAAPDIPEKYRTIGSTELRATVNEGKNDLNFNMKR
jgi:hypothetical protein